MRKRQLIWHIYRSGLEHPFQFVRPKHGKTFCGRPISKVKAAVSSLRFLDVAPGKKICKACDRKTAR